MALAYLKSAWHNVQTLLDEPVVWRIVGAAAFSLHDRSEWRPHTYVLWTALMLAAIEILTRVVIAIGKCLGSRSIKASGKPLESLEGIDLLFITFNKLMTAVFTQHMISYIWTAHGIVWRLGDITLANTLLALPLLYIVYDFVYALFHRALHHRSVYGLVHKHHHRQKVPFRGNADAINVHPFEFIVGEYNHMAAVHALLAGYGWAAAKLREVAPDFVARYPQAFDGSIHVIAVGVFIILGGILASLNHTRYDINAPWALYAVKFHDVHHGISVRSNYSQYSVFWDIVMGTFRPYPDETTSKLASSVSGPLDDEDVAAQPASQRDSDPAPAPPSSGTKKRRPSRTASPKKTK